MKDSADMENKNVEGIIKNINGFIRPHSVDWPAKIPFETPVVRGGKWLVPEGVACTRDILDWAQEDVETPGSHDAC